jgi:hypothetical protein
MAVIGKIVGDVWADCVGDMRLLLPAVTWSTSSCGLPVKHWFGCVDKSESKRPDIIRVRRGHWHWRSDNSNVCSLQPHGTGQQYVLYRRVCVTGFK